MTPFCLNKLPTALYAYWNIFIPLYIFQRIVRFGWISGGSRRMTLLRSDLCQVYSNTNKQSTIIWTRAVNIILDSLPVIDGIVQMQ